MFGHGARTRDCCGSGMRKGQARSAGTAGLAGVGWRDSEGALACDAADDALVLPAERP